MKLIRPAAVISVIMLLFCSCSQVAGNNSGGSGTVKEEQTGTTTSEISDEVQNKDRLQTKTIPDSVFYGKNTGTDKTFTGLEPLRSEELSLPEKTDYSNLSKKMIEHGFGAASGGKPNALTVQNQRFMDENGFNALCWDNKSNGKPVYLTFDVGYENGYTEKVLDVLRKKHVRAAFFCTQPELSDNSDAIARMINEGHIVGNHSVSHRNFAELSADEIKGEIQGFDDFIRKNFGYSAKYFRFPEGKYSEYSLKTVEDLGYTSVFWSVAYEDWDLSNQMPAGRALAILTERLHPGAVYLLHAVSPVNYEILGDFIDNARDRGYYFAELTDLNGGKRK